MEGPAGTGKTIGACKKLIDACMGHPGSQHLLCRQTRASMTDSILVTLESVIGDRHPEVTRVGREHRHSYRLGGSEIVIAGLDEPAKAFGTSWGLVVVEEAIEVSMDAFELFGRASRDPKLRRTGKIRSFPYHQRIAITNPGPPKHWLNIRATIAPENIRRIKSFQELTYLHSFNSSVQHGQMRRLMAAHQDNPVFFDVDRWRWTDEGEQYIASLSRMTGHRRARMLEGRWVAQEGVVFPEFNEAVHKIPSFSPPYSWPWYVGWDPGFAHPTGIPWITVAPTGDIIMADEIYEGGKSMAQHAETVLRRMPGRTVRRWYGDPHEFFSARAQGESCAAQARKAGLPSFFPWANQPKQAMVNSFRQLLINTCTYKSTGNRTGPCFYITENCVNGIMELQAWAFKKNAKGELVTGDDQYVDADNHLIGDPVVGMVSTGGLKWMDPGKHGIEIVTGSG